jgi:hypothetical protein
LDSIPNIQEALPCLLLKLMKKRVINAAFVQLNVPTILSLSGREISQDRLYGPTLFASGADIVWQCALLEA